MGVLSVCSMSNKNSMIHSVNESLTNHCVTDVCPVTGKHVDIGPALCLGALLALELHKAEDDVVDIVDRCV